MDQKPNVILITIDALRPGHLGFMGYKENTSPNIDNFAKESIVFKNAFSVGPTTPYSFPSILTSTYPLDFQGPAEIKKPRVLISEVFKKNGYATAAFHSSPYLSEYFGYNKGWDFFQDIHFSEYQKENKFSAFLRIGKRIFNKYAILFFPGIFFQLVYLRYRIEGPKKNKTRAGYVNKIVKDFLYSIKGKGRPFFIWIHYMDVHTPPLCYQKGQTCSYGELIGDCAGAAIWAYGNKGALKRFVRKKLKKYLPEILLSYEKAIQFLDNELGNLLNFFKKQNIYENSIICLSSDHGDEFLEHGGMGHNIQLYNEVLSVPLMIKIPGESNSADAEVKKKISLIDLAPTLCKLAGIEPPLSFKGKSLFDRLAKDDGFIFHQSAFSEKKGWQLDIEKKEQCRIACQNDNFKYIMDYRTGGEELYNLSNDPHEKKEISKNNPEALLKFRKKVGEFEKINPILSWKQS